MSTTQTGRLVCLCALALAFAVGAQAQQAAPEAPTVGQTPALSAFEGFTSVPVAARDAVRVPRLVRFSGELKDTKGALRTGIVGITFAIYAEPQGGAPLWMETQNIELDEQGRYTVLLGAASRDGIPLELFASGAARWLAIEVNSGQTGMPVPRVLLVSVPYALKAADAETLGGRAASEFLATTQLESAVRETVAVQVARQLEAHSAEKDGGSGPLINDGPSTFSGTNNTEIVLVTQLGTGAALRGTTPGQSALIAQTTHATGRGIFGLATTTGDTRAFGMLGRSDSLQGVGFQGTATSTTGANIGVQGFSFSTGGTALSGTASATTGATTGVYAEVRSATATAGRFRNTNTSGKLLSGIAGSTEVFRVDAAGNIFTAGTISGVSTTTSKVLALPATNAEGSAGVITLAGSRFAHAFGPANTFLGAGAGNFATTGSANAGMGTGALGANTTGSSNSALGHDALSSNTTGSSNAAVGTAALRFNTTGGQNAAVGGGAMENNTGGCCNAALGGSALHFNTTGNSNAAFGQSALLKNTTGLGNIGIGYSAGATGTDFVNANTTGSLNIFIGYQAGPGTSTQLENATAFGANALVNCSDCMVLGNGVNVGIGTSAPTERLEVAGTVKATSFAGSGAELTNLNAMSLSGFISSSGFVVQQTASTPNLIGGFSGNIVSEGVVGASIGGGGSSGNINQVTANFGTVAGGQKNTASGFSSIVGGFGNTASGIGSAIGGGGQNTASGSSSTIGGGERNAASSTWATVAGGSDNTASGSRSAVGGGESNIAAGFMATVAGGRCNRAGSIGTTDCGVGSVQGNFTTVGGGSSNLASGLAATVPGGYLNTAGGTYSFAAGRQARALHTGAFVWGDSTEADFSSTANNQFLIRASGNVGINTNSPQDVLHVAGEARVNSCLKDSAGTGIAGTCVSDARLKTNVAPLGALLERVARLEPVTFAWRAAEFPEFGFGAGRHTGLLAQQVEAVLPELVSNGERGFKAVRYQDLPLVLLQALRELKAEKDAQAAELAALRDELARIRARLDRDQP